MRNYRTYCLGVLNIVLIGTLPTIDWWFHQSELVRTNPALLPPKPQPIRLRHSLVKMPRPPKTLADWPLSVDTIDTSANCEPRNNVVYLKTHKTASSTLQNVVYRWGDRHNLTFALPTSGVLINFPLTRNQLVPSPSGTYNILANHVRFEPEAFREIMAPGTVYITILRDPRKQFQSHYNYFHCHSPRVYGAGLHEFLRDPWRYLDQALRRNLQETLCVDAIRNPQLYDLGFNSALPKKPSPAGESTSVDEWIDVLERSLHLVLIADYLLESLVLLKDIMCWDVDDVVVLDVNRRQSLFVQPTRAVSTVDSRGGDDDGNLHELIDSWNAGDAKLYRHFNRTLWRRLDSRIGRRAVAREVDAIQRRTREIVDTCLADIEWLSGTEYQTKNVYRTPLDNTVGTYTLKHGMRNDPLCQRLVLPAPNYLDFIRRKMKGEL